jgi:hypothetical protein
MTEALTMASSARQRSRAAARLCIQRCWAWLQQMQGAKVLQMQGAKVLQMQGAKVLQMQGAKVLQMHTLARPIVLRLGENAPQPKTVRRDETRGMQRGGDRQEHPAGKRKVTDCGTKHN